MAKLVFVFILLTNFLQTDNWSALRDVTYKSKVNPDGFDIPYPVFGEDVKKLDSTVILLKGYVIPLDKFGSQDYFMFSSLPYNNCFFCGGAGPETVVEVNAKADMEYTEKLIEIKGQLILNESDPDHHMYQLKNAELVEND